MTGVEDPREGGTVSADALRPLLAAVAARRRTCSYQQVAAELGLRGGGRIRRVATALERLLREDANAGRPLLAAVVVSRTGTGLPAAGFFVEAERLGLVGDSAHDHAAFHARELARVHAAHAE